jgi:diguanylate cyclase (GGDEF)-like protein/PAS domain S-box-containing protein
MSPRGHLSAGSTPTKKLLATVRPAHDGPALFATGSRLPHDPAGTIGEAPSISESSALNEVVRALDRHILEGRPRHGILQFICDGLGAATAYPIVSIALAQRDGRIPFGGGTGYALAAREGYSVLWDESPAGAGPNGTAMQTGQTQTVLLSETAFDWSAQAVAAGLAQLVAIPLAAPGAKLGVLCVAVGEKAILDVDRVSALESFAARLSLALQLADHHALMALQGAALAASSTALFITDAVGRIEWLNAAFERMSGYTKDDALGRTLNILRCDLQPADVFQGIWTTVRDGLIWRGEVVNRRKTGETYVVSQTVTPLVDQDGVVTHLVTAQEDVTAQRQAETRIEHMANHDSLTDLPNRTLLTERLQVALARGGRDGQAVGVLCLDLDRFKLVNDTLGHAMGDGLLREVAARLKASTRDRDLVARFGGDEFIVVVPNCDVNVAARVAERILDCLGQPARIGNQDVSVTASIGIALSSPEIRNVEALLKQADVAMYRVKATGRNGYVFFSPDLDSSPSSGLTIQAGLRHALATGELTLHYQPQIKASGGEFAGVEALLRWTSPLLGTLSPAEFIPVAEETGSIADIDRWALRTACAQAKVWQTAGIDVPRVAVNVSGVSFRRGQLVLWVEEALAAADLAPGCLEIELTEGILMHDAAKVADSLPALHRLGVRIALDDFGTGYSSLSYLKRFKVDVLKIDRSFVSGLPDDPDSAAIARVIVAMAKALRMETVAEGVETPAQAAFLASIGCDTLQGFLFSRAVPPSEVVRFSSNRRVAFGPFDRSTHPGAPQRPAEAIAQRR